MYNHLHFLKFALLLGISLGLNSVRADVVIMGASRDSTLIESDSGSLANGTGFLVSGLTGVSGPGIERALLGFDIASQVPAGSTITGVELRLFVGMQGRNSTSQEYTLHTVEQDWGEGITFATSGLGAPAVVGDSTWLHTFFDTGSWSTAGGDFDTMPSASQIIQGTDEFIWGSTTEMVADVQGWLDDPASNFGWMLRGDETLPHAARSFDSRESPLNPPLLTVTFDAPSVPEPSTIALVLLGSMFSCQTMSRGRSR